MAGPPAYGFGKHSSVISNHKIMCQKGRCHGEVAAARHRPLGGGLRESVTATILALADLGRKHEIQQGRPSGRQSSSTTSSNRRLDSSTGLAHYLDATEGLRLMASLRLWAAPRPDLEPKVQVRGANGDRY
jgi:hypothetical protein